MPEQQTNSDVMMFKKYKRLRFELDADGEQSSDVAGFRLREITELDDRQDAATIIDTWRFRLLASVAFAFVSGGLLVWLGLTLYSRQPETISFQLPEARPLTDVYEPLPAYLPDDLNGTLGGDLSLDGNAPGASQDLPAPSNQALLPTPANPASEGFDKEGTGSPPSKGKPPRTLIFDALGDSEPIGQGEASPTPSPTTPVKKSEISSPLLRRNTLIPAVLETPIDSSMAAGVRAVVTSDVRAADGRTVLAPRSSRLVGQYQGRSDKTGRRANVIWVRMIRPDGTAVSLRSGNISQQNFQQEFNASSIVSVLGKTAGARQGGTGSSQDFRIRPGEPIEVVTTRDVALGVAN